jgi:hypothetical protein
MAAMSMVAVPGATGNLFSQHVVGAPFRTTTAAILTVGMELSWASSAVAGGLLLTIVAFNGLFYLTGLMARLAGIVTWGYQRFAQSRVVVGGALLAVQIDGADRRWLQSPGARTPRRA